MYYSSGSGGGLGPCSSSSSSSNIPLPWNPTVRKMTYHVLNSLYKQTDNEKVQTFRIVSDQLFFKTDGSSSCPPPTTSNSNISKTKTTTASTTSKIQNEIIHDNNILPSPPAAPTTTNTIASDNSNLPTKKSSLLSNSMPPPISRIPLRMAASSGQKQQPPLGITGVAPWAMSSSSSSSTNNPTTRASGRKQQRNQKGQFSFDKKQKPPLTVTGVAPWAMQQQLPPSKASSATPTTTVVPHKRRAPEKEEEETKQQQQQEDGKDHNSNNHNNNTEASSFGFGLDYVLAYMERLKPPELEDNSGISFWAKAQMSETPTLLPKLKFHDLVFGHDLGVGAFGSVRYARLIDRNKTRSQWVEYAIKIVSTKKIKELGYEHSIQREIAILRVLSHPGIARLISNFRFKEGAYLVLEYASNGDLQMLLKKHGSLNIESTKFVIGEVVAALSYIHDIGFVYGDLKPENLVITESGHIKLTDFGACRPYTKKAKQSIRNKSKNLLSNLRDGGFKYGNHYNDNSNTKRKPLPSSTKTATTRAGDGDGATVAAENINDRKEKQSSSVWEDDEDVSDRNDDGKYTDDDKSEKEENHQHDNLQEIDEKSSTNDNDNNAENDKDEDSVEDEEEADLRIEGTTAYLPPEVVMGAIPTTGADSWALGCVLYQCLSGRPPLLEADDTLTRNRIVTFSMATNQQQHQDDGNSDKNTTSTTTIDDNDPLFQEKHALSIRSNINVKDLIQRLLDKIASKRLNMHEVAQHSFFDNGDYNVYDLHHQKAYPLDVGVISSSTDDNNSEGSDPVWSRRQFSSIWAPQPQAYDVSGVSANSKNSQSSLLFSGPIPDINIEDASAFFTSSSVGGVGNINSSVNSNANGRTNQRLRLPLSSSASSSQQQPEQQQQQQHSSITLQQRQTYTAIIEEEEEVEVELE